MTTVPIIILNWNGIDDTLECVGSLMQQSYSNFTIWLVDNGSGGRDAQLLEEKLGSNPKVKLIFNRKNLGFTRGNNAILKEILAMENPPQYIALLNNDTAADPHWLQNLIRCAEETKAGIVTSKMVNYFDHRYMDNAGHRMLNTAEIIPIGHMEPVGKFEERFENMGSCAGATLYSAAMLQHIGVFDEYFDTGYEDAELGARAVVLGYKSIFEPQAIVFHKISRSVKKIRNYEYLLKIQLNIFYSYFKIMPYPALLANLPALVFKYASVLLMDVVFLRWQFLKVMSEAIYRTIFKESQRIRQSRRAFFKKHHPVPSWPILKKQEFFLWFDIKRFYKFMILRKPTTFEKY